jgi:hypothetical protein
MKTGYYKYTAMAMWFKVDSDVNGRGFRFFLDKFQSKTEYFTFETRTIDFLKEGLLTGQVERIDEREFRLQLEKYLDWNLKNLEGLRRVLSATLEVTNRATLDLAISV